MSAAEGRPDLAAIAAEAEVKRETAVAVEQQAPSDEPMALAISELGYYEAELSSLRDAAVTLDEAEHS